MILAVVWWATPANAESKAKSWEQLVGCVYLDDEYNDADSFHVRCGDQEFFVRLYFVDAPESRMQQPERVHQQSEHFGITMDQVLRSGKEATALVKTRLQSPFAVWTRWASGAGRAKIPRYLAFVEVDGKDLAEMLIGAGLARTKGVTATSPFGGPTRERTEKLQALESQAREKRLGAWAEQVRDSGK